MKKTTGIATIVILGLAFSWLGATWYTGQRIQMEELQLRNRLNEALATALGGTGYTALLEPLSYQRHLFSSQVHYRLRLNGTPNDRPLSGAALEFVGYIEHGPFPKQSVIQGKVWPRLAFVQVELAQSEWVKALLALTQGVSPLNAGALISYGHDMEGHLTVAPLHYQHARDKVDFGGARMNIRYTQDMQQLHANIASAPFSMRLVSDTDGTLMQAAITGFTSHAEQKMGHFGFNVGRSELAVKSVMIHLDETHALPVTPAKSPDADSPLFPGQAPALTNTRLELDGLNIDMRRSEDETALNFQVDSRIARLRYNGDELGKGQAALKLENIEGESAQKLLQVYEEILRSLGPGEESPPISDRRAIGIAHAGFKLLAAKPRLRLETAAWETTQGKSTLELNLELSKPKHYIFSGSPPYSAFQAMLEMTSHLDLQLSISKPMVQGLVAVYARHHEGLDPLQASRAAADYTQAMSDSLQAQGLFTPEGDLLISTLRYADGKADLNGKEPPLELVKLLPKP